MRLLVLFGKATRGSWLTSCRVQIRRSGALSIIRGISLENNLEGKSLRSCRDIETEFLPANCTCNVATFSVLSNPTNWLHACFFRMITRWMGNLMASLPRGIRSKAPRVMFLLSNAWWRVFHQPSRCLRPPRYWMVSPIGHLQLNPWSEELSARCQSSVAFRNKPVSLKFPGKDPEAYRVRWLDWDGRPFGKRANWVETYVDHGSELSSAGCWKASASSWLISHNARLSRADEYGNKN